MNTQLAKTESSVPQLAVDYPAILKDIGLDPHDPKAQAVMLVCQRYGLDPVLRHVLLIKPQGSNEGRLYITRDGLLHVAHNSGALDGIEVLEQSSDDEFFIAKVAVYRKDMSHPFSYVGRYPKMRNEWEDVLDASGKKIWEPGQDGKNRPRRKQVEKPHPYGPEMAVKSAEVMALRRAFDVALAAKEEMWDSPEIVDAEMVEPKVSPGKERVEKSTEGSLSLPPSPVDTTSPPVTPPASTEAPAATEAQVRTLGIIASKHSWTDNERHSRAGVASFKDLTKAQASTLIDEWQKISDEAPASEQEEQR